LLNFGQAVNRLYRLLAPETRYRIKEWLNVSGHGSGVLDNLKAQRDAAGKKRLDNAMVAFTEKLSRSNINSIEGKKCLEIGTGFVPSDALCMHLLGASPIFTTDYNNIARIRFLSTATTGIDTEILLDAAAGFASKEDVRRRYNDFLAHFDKSTKYIERVGIKYIAPFNLATSTFIETDFDFIYSTDVLEHIAVSDISNIIENLTSLLVPNGKMIHYVNLRDHRDMENEPFEFLSDDTEYDPARDQDSRGNRMRRNHWMELFKKFPDLRTSAPWSEIGHDAHKPQRLLPDFRGVPHDDCFCSRIIIFSEKS